MKIKLGVKDDLSCLGMVVGWWARRRRDSTIGKVRDPKVGKQTYGLEITSRVRQRECMREECTCFFFSADIVERIAHRLQCG